MISTPNRVEQMRQALENGESVDLNRLAVLQMLDLVIAGREFVEQAITIQEGEDVAAAKLFK